MGILLIGSNLNTDGNNGTYESASSGWGTQPNPSIFSIGRFTTHKFEGTYSGKSTNLANGLSGNAQVMRLNFPITAGKKYIIKSKVLVPSLAAAISTNAAAQIGFSDAGLGDAFGDYTIDSHSTKTIAEMGATAATWFDIEMKITAITSSTRSLFAISVLSASSPGHLQTGGELYFDKTEVFEYEDDPVEATFVKTNCTCFGVNNGTITLTNTGGTSPFTYLWNDGSTSKNRTGLAPGTYSVTITDDYGDTLVLSGISITQPTEISCTPTIINNPCNGSSVGSITLSVSGGTAPYTYLWNDGATTKDRSGLPAGSYSVTITDANSCSKLFNFAAITQPSGISQAAVSITNNVCFGGTSGAINPSFTGGSGGFTYQWLDGSTSRTRSGLLAGTYNLTVFDSNGCSKLFTYVITSPTQIQITASIDGDDVSVSVTGGTSPYSYVWNDGVTTKDRTNLPNGNYTLTVIDANGCIRGASLVINDFKFYFSENPVWLPLIAANPETKPNLSFLGDVYIEDTYESGTFTKVFEAEHPAKADGSTNFEFAEVLNAYLEASLPEYNTNLIVREDGSFKRFYFKHTEKYGTPPVAGSFTQIDTYFVLLGGLSEQEHAKYIFFEPFIEVDKPFLTWQPKVKDVIAEQQEYLSYVVISELVAWLRLKARIRYDDDTEIVVNIRTIVGVEPYEVYRAAVGYNAIDIGGYNPSKTVVAYDVWLANQSNVAITEERTFNLIDSEDHHKVYLYLNSMGRWDTLLAKGRGAEILKTTSDVLDRALEIGYSYDNREQVVTNKTGQFENLITIGDLTNEERGYLVDFAISKQVYQITNSGFLPVRIEMELNALDELSQLQEVAFTAYPPITRKYTPEL
jgi:hypothetical protein